MLERESWPVSVMTLCGLSAVVLCDGSKEQHESADHIKPSKSPLNELMLSFI